MLGVGCQLKPVGQRYSPNWYQVALMNYGRVAGRFGYGKYDVDAGVKMLAAPGMLVVDQRGPGHTRMRAEFRFSSRVERRAAFALAKAVYAAAIGRL